MRNESTTEADERGEDRLLAPEDVAAFFRVPKSTLYAWRYRGEGPPALRIGKHLRYKREDVLEWIDRQSDRGQL